jgi:signal transduction histidine kinase
MEQTLKILIVEDDEVDRAMVRSALGASGLDARFSDAASGAEGVRLLTSEIFDCALLDHQLCDVDGLSVLREVRQRGCDTPIIMLTGQGDEQLAVEIMKAGANDYLSKARISRDLLSHSVRHVVRLHAAQTEALAAAEASERRYRLLAEEMKRLKEAAEAANAAKDRFLSVLSHELRTPLTPVLSTVQALESSPGLAPDLKAALEMVRRNVELEARLIDDLLDLTRIGKGKIQLVLGTVNVHDCVQNVLATSRTELTAKGIDLRVDLSPDSAWALADVARVQQVFWNLLNNALKFTPDGGSINVRTSLVQSGDSRRVVLEVQDSGIGIDPEVLPRIFDAFEQGERGITRKFGGLGLGLSISRSLMQMQGGTLTAESQGKGKGATFRAEFVPAAVPRDAGAADASPAASETQGKSLRILLVDDHQDTAHAMGRLLETLGHSVILADTVQGALGEFANGPFDLLISDIGLPDGSGLELLRQLRRDHAVPGIALSGFGMDEDVQKSKDAGFSRHLTKPINFQKLELAIKEVTEEESKLS